VNPLPSSRANAARATTATMIAAPRGVAHQGRAADAGATDGRPRMGECDCIRELAAKTAMTEVQSPHV
jgi:hypothetical protein